MPNDRTACATRRSNVPPYRELLEIPEKRATGDYKRTRFGRESRQSSSLAAGRRFVPLNANPGRVERYNMPNYVALLVPTATTAALLLVARAQESSLEHYPLPWSQVEFKPIVDNDRLFKKYKECLIMDKPLGCPRDVLQFKKIIPEVVETLCAKCLPEHVQRVKEGLEYICKTRRSDFEEVRKLKDPTGAIQSKFEGRFGKINC